jgi:hypothetical protein
VTGNRIAGLGLGLGLFATSLSAQQIPTTAEWSLRGLRSALCVEFLVEPGAAAEAIDKRVTPSPIERYAARFPVLAREAEGDRTYAGWIPAELCWFAFDSAFAKGRKVVVDRGRNPVVVGYVALGGVFASDSTALASASIFSNADPLVAVTVDARAKVDPIEYILGPVPDLELDTLERRHEIRRGRLTLQWDGHRGTTPRPVAPKTVRIFAESLGYGVFDVNLTLTPDSAFVATGNLRVQGRGPLLDAMAASPIRFVTSYLVGGDMEWKFQR